MPVVNGVNSGRPDGTIRIVLPADPRFLATLRVAVRAAAALSDLVADDIEDMQIAVDEAATLLLAVASPLPGQELCAELLVAPTSFRAEVSVQSASGKVIARDGLAWLMLTGLDPEVRVTDDGLVVAIAFGRTGA